MTYRYKGDSNMSEKTNFRAIDKTIYLISDIKSMRRYKIKKTEEAKTVENTKHKCVVTLVNIGPVQVTKSVYNQIQETLRKYTVMNSDSDSETDHSDVDIKSEK
jgi:hypothetical protein